MLFRIKIVIIEKQLDMETLQQPIVSEEGTIESSNEKVDSLPRATENVKIMTQGKDASPESSSR